MKIGDVLGDKYRIEKKLGSGGMGSVYLCTNMELGNQWAVKYIKKDSGREMLFAEAEILKKLNHISLPKIVDVFSDETGIYIIESYIEGISLDKKIQRYGRFNEEIVIDWALELCDALIYLHNLKPRPIIYRDMKPSNIIITPQNHAVLVDFGISAEYHKYARQNVVAAGTYAYAAPEQLIGGERKGGMGVDYRTDIYSLGVTLYQLLLGHLPGHDAPTFGNSNKRLSKRMESIVLKCVEKRAENRYQRVEYLRDALEGVKKYHILKEIKNKNKLRLWIGLSILLSLATYGTVILGLASTIDK